MIPGCWSGQGAIEPPPKGPWGPVFPSATPPRRCQAPRILACDPPTRSRWGRQRVVEYVPKDLRLRNFQSALARRRLTSVVLWSRELVVDRRPERLRGPLAPPWRRWTSVVLWSQARVVDPYPERLRGQLAPPWR